MDSTIKPTDDSDDYVDPEEADYDSPEWQETERNAKSFMDNTKKREVAKAMHSILSKGKEQGLAEGKGNFEKALDKLSGNWSGWYKDESSDPNIEKYFFDDGEGGYDASGTIEHDLQTGQVYVNYRGDEYHGPDVEGTFDNFGEAMRALRGGGGSHGGKAPNFDRLGDREPYTSDDLYKSDRVGRKGSLSGGASNKLKQSIQFNKGRLGPKGVLPEQGLAEGGNDTVNALVSLRATVKQIQTGRSEYPQGFASQLEVALYDAINALRDSQEQGAQNTVNELAELRAVAKQVQSGKMEFPQGYTGHLEWVLYDAIKQIQSSSQGMAEGFGDTITRGIRRAANAIIPGAEKDAGDYGAGKWNKNTNTNRNNLIDWITLNQLDVYEDELLGYFDKFVDGGGSERKAGEQAINTWKARMKRDGESVRKPEDVAEEEINDPLDPNRMDNRNRPTKRNIQARLGHDERGDARVRAGQERSTHARNKPQLPESAMDDNAIWSRYGHYSAGDLQSEFPNISPEDAEVIVKNAEKGWTDPTYKQKYRDNVVALVKQVMAQPGLAEGTDPILARIKKLSGL